MEKLNLHSPDFTQANIEKLAELFPNCVTETRAADDTLKKAIDFDLLKQELSTSIVEGPQERYQLNWPGKREALLTANAPIAKTLRPCREESVDFDTTQNLYIEGDNLDALKLLQETYLGKVKMIYIDPPYNTGNDFIYDDDFAENSEAYFERSNQKDEVGNRLVANNESNGRFHSDWLSMMYSRLKLARNLLRDDGVIFISIDDNEIHNVRKICDEVFGENNFVSSFIWQKRKTRENRKVFSTNHDFIICYSKNKSTFEKIRNRLPLTEEARSRYSNPDNDIRGDWQSVALTAQAGHGTASQFYTITTPSGRKIDPASGNCWRVTQNKLNTLIEDNRIWFGADGNNVPRQKLFLSEQEAGLTPHTLWLANEVGTTDSAKRMLNDLFGGITVFDTPKPIELLNRIIQITTDRNDIILDFFSGSSASAHSVMALNAEDGGNRKFIMVQLPEVCDPKSEAYKAGYKTIAEIGKERIRRAGQKVKASVGEALASNSDADKTIAAKIDSAVAAKAAPTGINPTVINPTAIDIGFRVLKVDSSNMKDVYYTPDKLMQGDLEQFTDNIRDDSTSEDLLFQVLLDWGVDLTLPITMERMSGKDEGGRMKDGQKAELGRLKDEKGGENSSSSLQPSSFRKEFQVFFVDDNALAACFDEDITEAFVKELAARHPMRVVFRDAGFASDSVKINIEQIFKLISPATEIKTL